MKKSILFVLLFVISSAYTQDWEKDINLLKVTLD